MGRRHRDRPLAGGPPPRRSAGEVRRRAEGQAAMMMIESVLMALIDRSVLSKADVLESIEIVIETKRNMAADGQSVDVEHAAEGLLVNLANSLMASTVPKDRPA